MYKETQLAISMVNNSDWIWVAIRGGPDYFT